MKKHDYRPKPFYFLTDVSEEALSEKSIRKSVSELERLGFGGCVVFNKPPNGFSRENFLGPRWFQCIRRFAESARERGMEIWINDGFNFPPGDAGGRIEALEPGLKQRYLGLNDMGEVEEYIADWGFPAFEEPRSSELFIELVYEPHRRELGDLFGNGIAGFFSDADNRRVDYGRFERMGQRNYFPWSRRFASLFLECFGYDITPHLKGILTFSDSVAGYDYWRLAGELYQEWFAGNYRWCHENGLEYTFHTSDLGLYHWDHYPRSSVFTEGDYFNQARFATWPGTDHELSYLDSCYGARSENLRVPYVFWGANIPALEGGEEYRKVRGDTRAKLAGSAAHLFHRQGAMCEMFAATNWSCTPSLLRDIAAWQIMQGITFIVPHAYHHRLYGETKYFAPPDFSHHNNWSQALPEINVTLTRWCEIAARGELTAEVALLLPYRPMWEGYGDSNRYYIAAEALNRLPHGFVAVPPERLFDFDRSFKYVVNTGCELSMEWRSEALKRGITILEVEELNRLPQIPECHWQGSGRPHFMRRITMEGPILLLANIEDDVPISGTLTWQKSEYHISLEPGEIAWWTPEATEFNLSHKIEQSTPLPDMARVVWDTPNCIPLYRWENAEYDAIPATTQETSMFFRWKNNEDIPNPELWLPETFMNLIAAIRCDGTELPLNTFRHTKLFDDHYRAYTLPASYSGSHTLELSKKSPKAISREFQIYIFGEFDIVLAVSGPSVASYSQYLWETRIPRYAELSLDKRRNELRTDRSWSEQGHPFYSGGATYCCETEVPADATLYLPNAECIAELAVDGKSLGLKCWSPFSWQLPEGRHTITLIVRNTLANRLEGYRAASGITNGWYLRTIR